MFLQLNYLSTYEKTTLQMLYYSTWLEDTVAFEDMTS